MSRQQLIDVALLFNSRLPRSRQIEVSDVATNAHIRHSIETLVGIVPDIPGAPKAVKSRTLSKSTRIPLLPEDTPLDILPSPPTSPLAMRVPRRRGPPLRASPPRMLESLREEDEEQFFVNQRLLKRRKLSGADATPIHFSYGSISDGTMNLASPDGALKISTSIEMLFTPASVISPVKRMVLSESSPLQDCVADSDNCVVTSVQSGVTTQLLTKPTYTSRVPVTTNGRLARETTFSCRSGIDDPVSMDVSWEEQTSNLKGRSDLFG